MKDEKGWGGGAFEHCMWGRTFSHAWRKLRDNEGASARSPSLSGAGGVGTDSFPSQEALLRDLREYLNPHELEDSL